MNIVNKFNELRQKYYRDLMERAQYESRVASNLGDHIRSVELYYRYLHYKHKYVKAGGKE